MYKKKAKNIQRKSKEKKDLMRMKGRNKRRNKVKNRNYKKILSFCYYLVL